MREHGRQLLLQCQRVMHVWFVQLVRGRRRSGYRPCRNVLDVQLERGLWMWA